MYTYVIYKFDPDSGKSDLISYGDIKADNVEEAATGVLMNIGDEIIMKVYKSKAQIMFIDQSKFCDIDPKLELGDQIAAAATVFNYAAICDMIPARIATVKIINNSHFGCM